MLYYEGDAMKVSELSRFLQEGKDRLSPLLVLTHDYPDPDALASAYALFHLAREGFGIRAKIAYGGGIGRIENREMIRLLKIPVYKVHLSEFKVFENIALVDTQPSFGNNPFPRERRATIVIDQHALASPPDADFTLVDTQAGATSALMARELLAADIKIPSRLATALVYGILSDTLDFHRITRGETIETYLQMLHLADVRLLARIQNPSRPREFFGDLARGINKATIQENLVVSHLGMVKNPDFVAQMADFLLTCEGVEWAFCTGRHGEDLHLSLRTSIPETSAAAVLRGIVDHPRQAGGHGQIAGGKIRIGRAMGQRTRDPIEQSLTVRLVGRLRITRQNQSRLLVRSPESNSIPGMEL
jgi:nanoRNase/pAp phosphatase (c-di-AMP/oligoRNAs hydrolase)